MSANHAIDLAAPIAGGLYAVGGIFAQAAPHPELSWVGLLLQTGSAGMVLITVYLFLDDRKRSEEATRQHQLQILTRVEQIQAEAIKAASETRAEYRQALSDAIGRLEHAQDLLNQDREREDHS